jgi:hypothetical protein
MWKNQNQKREGEIKKLRRGQTKKLVFTENY